VSRDVKTQLPGVPGLPPRVGAHADGAGTLPPRILTYIDAVVHAAGDEGVPLVSAVVFGSVVTGGYSEAASDVDMILVVADAASPEQVARLRAAVDRVERLHGLRDPADDVAGALDRLVRKVTANVRSFFTCTRADLLSGDVRRLLGISAFQAAFVDRIVLHSILDSAVTVWGEELLASVPRPAIRRIDVLKACYGLVNQVVLTAALFPFVDTATKYAMGALKRSVHSCYYCYHRRPAALVEEIAFLQQRQGRNPALEELLRLRGDYRTSLAFVLSCLPAIVRLHAHTALDNPLAEGSVQGA
jgi:predicted nucleotidyltransferase